MKPEEFIYIPGIRKALKEDKLIIFVGAGLSQIANNPNWGNLVKNILEHVYEETKNQYFLYYIESKELRVKKLFEVLGILEGKYKKEVIEGLVRNIKNECVLESHKKIFQVSKKIITTNYDKLLEYNSNSIEAFTYKNEYHVSNLHGKNEFIFKLHGSISEPHECILFESQYKSLYNADNGAIFQIGNLILNNTFIFIGFSFKDPYVREYFERIDKILSGYSNRHYLISTEIDENLANKNYLDVVKINDWDKLIPFLDNLIMLKKELKNDYTEEESSTDIAEKKVKSNVSIINVEDLILLEGIYPVNLISNSDSFFYTQMTIDEVMDYEDGTLYFSKEYLNHLIMARVNFLNRKIKEVTEIDEVETIKHFDVETIIKSLSIAGIYGFQKVVISMINNLRFSTTTLESNYDNYEEIYEQGDCYELYGLDIVSSMSLNDYIIYIAGWYFANNIFDYTYEDIKTSSFEYAIDIIKFKKYIIFSNEIEFHRAYQSAIERVIYERGDSFEYYELEEINKIIGWQTVSLQEGKVAFLSDYSIYDTLKFLV